MVALRTMVVLVLLALAVKPACAAETLVALDAVTSLEQQADAAVPRDRCFLYMRLVQSLTELEGQQMEAGDSEHAALTLTALQRIAAKLTAAAGQDTRKLKDVEMELGQSTRRLTDMLHLATDAERVSMNGAVAKLQAAHERVLALVFAR